MKTLEHFKQKIVDLSRINVNKGDAYSHNYKTSQKQRNENRLMTAFNIKEELNKIQTLM